MRFWRVDNHSIDATYESAIPPVRSELLREIVDHLPVRERHMVERVVFGSEHAAVAGRELGLDPSESRQLLALALDRTRVWVLFVTEGGDPDVLFT